MPLPLPDRFVAACLSRVVGKEAAFLSELRLVVLMCSDLLVDQVLRVLRGDVLRQSSVLLVTPHAPQSQTRTGWRRLRVRMRPERRVTVARLLGDEETDVRTYDVVGVDAADGIEQDR